MSDSRKGDESDTPTIYTKNDGTQVYSYKDGKVIYKKPDGTQNVMLPDKQLTHDKQVYIKPKSNPVTTQKTIEELPFQPKIVNPNSLFGGKRKSRRVRKNKSKRKSRKGKARKNRRKTNRRR